MNSMKMQNDRILKEELPRSKQGDKILVTGPTTGALYAVADKMRHDTPDTIDVAKKLLMELAQKALRIKPKKESWGFL